MSAELAFDATELAEMQWAQNAHMMDVCVIYAHGEGSQDAYGNPIVTWSAGSALACGVKFSNERDAVDETRWPMWDAQMRLPIATSVDSRDLVVLTLRHNAADVTDEVYRPIGNPRRGPSGLVLDLERVTDDVRVAGDLWADGTTLWADGTLWGQATA